MRKSQTHKTADSDGRMYCTRTPDDAARIWVDSRAIGFGGDMGIEWKCMGIW